MFEKQEIVITVIAGGVLILFLVSVFVLSIIKYNKRAVKELEEKRTMREKYESQLLQSKLETQEETFQQIGKELHDNLGQLLSTARMLLNLTEKKLHNPPDTLISANNTLAEALAQLRLLSKSLDNEWLSQFSLIHNLRAEAERINQANGEIVISLNLSDRLPFPPDQQIILFRIIQEAIQNSLKHSQASKIDILLVRDHSIQITIADNGVGFSPDRAQGMGLRNMRHRTAILEGNIEWISNEYGGTTVFISIPIKDDSQ